MKGDTDYEEITEKSIGSNEHCGGKRNNLYLRLCKQFI